MALRSLAITYLAVLALAVWLIGTSAELLPGQVAARFDSAGNPLTYHPRDNYVEFILLLSVGLSMAISAIMMIIPRQFPALMRIPNRDFWFAPEQRGESLKYLARQGIFLGMVVTVFFTSIHWLVVQANRNEPPHLSVEYFYGAGFLFVLAIAAFIQTIRNRFKLL